MRILNINPINPQPRLIKQVVEVLEEGGVVAYPTDTVYGLGCDIFNKKAIQRVHRIKDQPPGRNFSFICPGLTELSQYAMVTNYAYKTLKRLLPGPYTFILAGTRIVPKMMLHKRKEVGIRVPDHPIPRALAEGLGRPILTASATGANGATLKEALDVAEMYGTQLDLIIDGGPAPNQLSSVVSLIDDAPLVIREGAGPVEEFRV